VPIEKIAVAPLENFCAESQRTLVSARVPIRSTTHSDYQAFVASKPEVKPVTVQQYIRYADGLVPRAEMISCKFKSADHIRAEHGPNAAGAPSSCAFLNRRTLDGVLSSLSKRERKMLQFKSGTAVLIDADIMATQGPQWLEPFRMVWVDVGGTLRIQAKGMRNDWTDPRLANAPLRLKGTHYCHLIAPDYLKALLLGEAKITYDVIPPSANR
jgi:hypothetical protein